MILIFNLFSCKASAASFTKDHLKDIVDNLNEKTQFVCLVDRINNDLVLNSSKTDDHFKESLQQNIDLLQRNINNLLLSYPSLSENDKHKLFIYFWSKCLEVGIVSDKEINKSPKYKLPLLLQIIYQHEHSDSSKKVEFFKKYGGFITSSLEDLNLESHDSAIEIILNYIYLYPDKDPKFSKKLLNTLINYNLELLPLWNDDEVYEVFFKIRRILNEKYYVVLDKLLCVDSIHVTEKFIDLIFNFISMTSRSDKETGKALANTHFANIFHLVLKKSQYLRNKYKEISDPIDDKQNCDMSVFQQICEKYHLLPRYDSINVIMVSKKFDQGEISLHERNCLIGILNIGRIRNYFFKKSAKYCLLPVLHVKNYEGNYFLHLFYLINIQENKYITEGEGLENLFWHDDSNSLLIEAAKNRKLNSLHFMMMLIKNKYLLYDKDKSNIFHHLIFGNKEFIGNKSFDDELIFVSKLRSFLYSKKISNEILINLLNQRNNFGETPLSLAAKQGLVVVFNLFKNYILEYQYFNNQDHTYILDLPAILVDGLVKRFERVGDEKILTLLKNMGADDFARVQLEDHLSKDLLQKKMTLLEETLQVKLDHEDESSFKEKFSFYLSDILIFIETNHLYFYFCKQTLDRQFDMIEKHIEILTNKLLLSLSKIDFDEYFSLVCKGLNKTFSLVQLSEKKDHLKKIFRKVEKNLHIDDDTIEKDHELLIKLLGY